MPPTATTPTVIDGIITQLTIAKSAVHRNVDGVTHEESLRRADPGASSINWIVGHLFGSRNGVLAALGETPLMPRERLAQYSRGSSGDLDEPLRLEELLDLYDRTQAPLIASLQRLTDDQLTSKSPLRSPAGDNATLAEALSAMTLHECYHVGQLGMARRFVGKKGAI